MFLTRSGGSNRSDVFIMKWVMNDSFGKNFASFSWKKKSYKLRYYATLVSERRIICINYISASFCSVYPTPCLWTRSLLFYLNLILISNLLITAYCNMLSIQCQNCPSLTLSSFMETSFANYCFPQNTSWASAFLSVTRSLHHFGYSFRYSSLKQWPYCNKDSDYSA